MLSIRIFWPFWGPPEDILVAGFDCTGYAYNGPHLYTVKSGLQARMELNAQPGVSARTDQAVSATNQNLDISTPIFDRVIMWECILLAQIIF